MNRRISNGARSWSRITYGLKLIHSGSQLVVFFVYWGSVYRWISLTVSKLNATLLLPLRAEATLARICVFLISRSTLRRRGWGGSIAFTFRKVKMFLFVLQNTFCLMIAAYPNKAWRSVFLRMWCALTISHSAILIRFGFSSLAHSLLSFFGYRLLFALLCHSLAVFVLLSCPMYWSWLRWTSSKIFLSFL